MQAEKNERSIQDMLHTSDELRCSSAHSLLHTCIQEPDVRIQIFAQTRKCRVEAEITSGSGLCRESLTRTPCQHALRPTASPLNHCPPVSLCLTPPSHGHCSGCAQVASAGNHRTTRDGGPTLLLVHKAPNPSHAPPHIRICALCPLNTP